jgi:transposase
MYHRLNILHFLYNVDIKKMKGMTIQEVANALGISYFAARQRIVRAGIKPISKEALYPENTLDLVKNSPGKGRPKKAAPEPEPAKPKAGKPAKPRRSPK